MAGVLDEYMQAASDFFSPSAPAQPARPAGHHHHHHHHGRHAAAPEESLLGIFGHLITDTAHDVGTVVNREGMDAVMNDTAGVIDRDNAHHELANRFQVVGDDYHGRRRSNTVSQAEFDSVAHLYSDMRLGRGDLTVDAAQSQVVSSGDPTAPNKTEVAALPADEQDAWRTHAMSDIATILQTRTGREELGLLAANANHRHTTIGPHMMMAGLPDGTNATSVAANFAASRLQADGSAGAGSDVAVRFNQGDRLYGGDAAARRNPWMDSMRSDVTLIHELTHALYETLGQEDPTAIQATDGPQTPQMARDANARESGVPIARAEHQAVAIGQYANRHWGENPYRLDRLEMARDHAVGTHHGTGHGHRDSDADMTVRDSYVGMPLHHRRHH